MSKNRMQQEKKAMRKKRQKITKPILGKLPFDGIEKGRIGGVELLSQLERQRILTGEMMEEVIDYVNLIKVCP